MSACVTSTANDLDPVGIIAAVATVAAAAVAPAPLSGSAVATTSCLTTQSSSSSSEGASPIRAVSSEEDAGCSRPVLLPCPLADIVTVDVIAPLDEREEDDDADSVTSAVGDSSSGGEAGHVSAADVDDDDTRIGDRLSPSETVATAAVVAAELVAANSASSSSAVSSHSRVPGFQGHEDEPIIVDDHHHNADAVAAPPTDNKVAAGDIELDEELVVDQGLADVARGPDGDEVGGNSRSSSASFPFSRRVPPEDGPLAGPDDGGDSANDSVDIVIEEQYEEFEDEELEVDDDDSSSIVELNPEEDMGEGIELDDDGVDRDEEEEAEDSGFRLLRPPKLVLGLDRFEPAPEATAMVCKNLFRDIAARRNLFGDEAAGAGPSAAGRWPSLGVGPGSRLSGSGGGSSHGSKSFRDKLIMKRKPTADSKEHPGKKPCLTGSDAEESAALSLISIVDTSEKLGAVVATTSTHNHKKRIPTKENPPPDLAPWLETFKLWSNAERLMALDQLIDLCDPTQVRHMMAVIEPQFQRDFISLLPKELALYVLSFLEPKDLLKAAQTCRYWRVLAEDNLLWREKCKEAGIIEVRTPLQKKRSKICALQSPWKIAYMRQHNIEMNWRFRPIRPPKVLKGHDDHVITCLQFCGSRIVSGSDDNTLKVWSATTGKCLKTLVGHTGGVWSSQMAGSIIVSGSTDRTLKVWNADTGQCVHTLYGHTSTVRCMHLHENKVVSGSRDATLRLWDIESGHCLHVLIGHVAAVRCVQYDGRLVVSGAYDYVVKVWNPEREECLHTLQGHTNRVYSLQFDGVHVVSGSLDTSIRVWDVETGACKHTLMGHQSLTSGMELKNNILVSGNADSTVKVWDITTGQCLQTLSGVHKHNSAVTCLQFNSKFVITSSDDGTVKLWDLKTGDFVRNLVALDSGGSGGVVWRIRASPTKLVCAVGSRNGTEETKLMVLDFDAQGATIAPSDAVENEVTTIK